MKEDLREIVILRKIPFSYNLRRQMYFLRKTEMADCPVRSALLIKRVSFLSEGEKLM